MKHLAYVAFALVLVGSVSTANAAGTKCKGDALREKPPVPNYPHHIRNVVWRNTRAMCLQELSSKSNNPVIPSQTRQESPINKDAPNNSSPQTSP
jgi:hypothetical protein